MKAYTEVLRLRDFRRLIFGVACNILGDGATLTAISWLTVERSGARGLGILGVCYTVPVLAGGAVVGPLLDRFSRRALLISDCAFRGCVVASLPLLAWLHLLAAWQIYAVAACYGLLKIIPLAAVPAVIPELVPAGQLQAASGLESSALGIGSVLGPSLGAVLIPLIGAVNVLLVDAGSYWLFAMVVVSLHARLARPARIRADAGGWAPILLLLLRDRFLLFITAGFMAYNVSAGALIVILPWLARYRFPGGPRILGLLLAIGAAAELAGSLISGAVRTADRQMVRIGLLQCGAGLSFGLLFFQRLPAVAAGLILSSLLTGPMTVLGGTVRLLRTPIDLRGRTMTLTRTLMSGALPLGSAVAGVALAGGGYSALIVVVSLIAALPGLGMAISLRNTRIRPAATSAAPAPSSPQRAVSGADLPSP